MTVVSKACLGPRSYASIAGAASSNKRQAKTTNCLAFGRPELEQERVD